jgi:hypothetical protein
MRTVSSSTYDTLIGTETTTIEPFTPSGRLKLRRDQAAYRDSRYCRLLVEIFVIHGAH